jgi:hypothetical protein
VNGVTVITTSINRKYMSRRNEYYNRYNNENSNYAPRASKSSTGDKLFKVTTSPVNADGTFSATFTGLLNYTGGGTVSGVWDFGDGKTIKYNGDKPFTHHGYKAGQKYAVKLSITKSYLRDWKKDQYLMEKTIEIGEKGAQSKATFKQSKV